MQYVCMSEMQNASDIWSQCFGNDFSDIVSDIRNAFRIFRICYDASPNAVAAHVNFTVRLLMMGHCWLNVVIYYTRSKALDRRWVRRWRKEYRLNSLLRVKTRWQYFPRLWQDTFRRLRVTVLSRSITLRNIIETRYLNMRISSLPMTVWSLLFYTFALVCNMVFKLIQTVDIVGKLRFSRLDATSCTAKRHKRQ